jgi:hypothetical protein
MIKRLVYGLLFGLLVGGLLAAAVVKGIGMLAFTGGGGTALAYVFAAVTGVLVGLVAGKPIWASGGQIEAGLKAFFGALLASGMMFALRRWVHFDLDLHSLGLGPAAPTAAGMLPAVALPVIAAVLGGFYEADNTPAPEGEKDKDKDKKAGAKAAASSANGKKVRVESKDEDDEEALSAPAKKSAKK